MQGVDRRARKTKLAIQEAFLTLLDANKMDKITVLNITELADINRSTFYLHFQDTYHLLEEIENNLLNSLLEIGKETQMEIKQCESFSPLEQGLYAVYSYIQSHAREFKLLLGENGSPSFQAKITRSMKINIQHILSTFHSNPGNQITNPYLYAFFSAANLGIVMEWLRSGLDKTPLELSKLTNSLVKGAIEGHFNVEKLKSPFNSHKSTQNK